MLPALSAIADSTHIETQIQPVSLPLRFTLQLGVQLAAVTAGGAQQTSGPAPVTSQLAPLLTAVCRLLNQRPFVLPEPEDTAAMLRLAELLVAAAACDSVSAAAVPKDAQPLAWRTRLVLAPLMLDGTGVAGRGEPKSAAALRPPSLQALPSAMAVPLARAALPLANAISSPSQGGLYT